VARSLEYEGESLGDEQEIGNFDRRLNTIDKPAKRNNRTANTKSRKRRNGSIDAVLNNSQELIHAENFIIGRLYSKMKK